MKHKTSVNVKSAYHEKFVTLNTNRSQYVDEIYFKEVMGDNDKSTDEKF
jgi:hypothetical protein